MVAVVPRFLLSLLLSAALLMSIGTQAFAQSTMVDPGFPIIAMRQLKTHAANGFPEHIPELPLPFATQPTEMVKIQNGQVTVLDCKLPANPATENYEICDHAKLSFDGRWVYYTKFTKPTSSNDISNSSDIYKIDLVTLEKVRLTFQEFTPNTGVLNWGLDPKNTAKQAGKASVSHGVFNMHPVPVPFKNGKTMVAFVSSRDMFGRSRRGNDNPATRIYVGHDYGTEGIKNVRNIDSMFLDLVGRVNILSTGKLFASYLHTQGLRHLEGRASGVWEINPDGREWSPRVSALDGNIIWRGETETGSREIVSVGYYQLKNAGMGSFIACPTVPPAGQPQFGFSYPRDPRNSMVFSFPCTGGRVVTPFGHIGDEASNKDSNNTYMGKITNAAAAPGNRMLAVWSGNSPANRDNRPELGMDAMRIVMFGDKAEITHPSQMQVLVYNPSYHYIQPVAAVSYKSIYGIDQPAELPWLPNDGSVHAELPAGTPYGLIGTASFLNNFRDSTMPNYNEGVTPRGFYATTPLSTFDGKKIYSGEGNWSERGGDNGYYTKDDIYAVRILGMSAFSEGSASPGNFIASHETEQLTILGEIPLRKYNAQGQEILDDEGNPDTSFLAKIPADMAYTFQTLDRKGMVLNMAQTWHQVRPGEGRWDCGGCHGHSTSGSDFSKKAAAKPDYQVVDLTKRAQILIKNLSTGKLVVQPQATQTHIPEFNRDIKPILESKCASCHHKKNGNVPPGVQPGGLDLANFAAGKNGQPIAYNILTFGNSDGDLPGGYFTRNADDYWVIRRYGSRSSYLTWKIFGTRVDGFTNKDLPTPTVLWDKATFPTNISPAWWEHRDRDFLGSSCPPPNSGVPTLTEEEKLKFVRWIDMGLAISKPGVGKLGYDRDDSRPVVSLVSPRKEKNFGALKTIRLGLSDYCPNCVGESLDMTSFSVKADFTINGKTPGTELASNFAMVDDHVWSMNVSPNIAALSRGTLTIRIKDKAGNLRVTETIFSVSSGNGPAAPVNLRMLSKNESLRSATFAWNPVTTLANGNPLPSGSKVSYKILVGPSSGQFSRTIDVGQVTQATVSQLLAGNSYVLIRARILGTTEEESESNEVSLNIRSNVDSDGDGLTNEDEAAYGTNPQKADSDGDGLTDREEVLAGTDPLDAGSRLRTPPRNEVCLPWNSFISWNIAELTNMTENTVQVSTVLRDIQGSVKESLNISIPARAQFDVLIHDSFARRGLQNSYGMFCATSVGVTDALAGRMAFYQPSTERDRQFDFGFAIEAREGYSGRQFVALNTFDPDLSATAGSQMMANWITVLNRDTAAGSGALKFYDQNGALYSSRSLQLPAGARIDISGHDVGLNKIGTIVWEPANSTLRFEVFAIRYLIDKATGKLNRAFPLEAQAGNGAEMVVPVDTRGMSSILELINASNLPSVIAVELANDAGAVVSNDRLNIPGFGTQHYIVDGKLNGFGSARIAAFDSNGARVRSGAVAFGLFYARNLDRSVQFGYSLPALQPIVGTNGKLRGSYNTWLSQTPTVIIASGTSTAAAVNLSLNLIRYDGSVVTPSGGLVAPLDTGGGLEIPLTSIESENQYGVVDISVSGANGNPRVLGWVLRLKPGEFVLPTSLNSQR